jgi:hypothetical protein
VLEKINGIIPKTPLESFAKNTMINTFPEVPTSGVYASYEEQGYDHAYAMMVPDVDFNDKMDYGDYLNLKTEDKEFIHTCLLRFELVDGFIWAIS